MITLYTAPACPRCKALASFLQDIGQPFQERDASSSDALSDLRADWGYYGLAMPVLTVDTMLFTPQDLFDGADDLKKAGLKAYLEHK